MRIGKVIGTLTLNRAHPTFQGATLKAVVPLSLDELPDGGSEGVQEGSEFIVAWDQLGAGEGSLIAISEGPEASMPFRPEIKPVEAYNAAILDTLEVDASLLDGE